MNALKALIAIGLLATAARADSVVDSIRDACDKADGGDLAGARAEAEQALRLAPDHPDVNTFAALFRTFYGDDAGARRLLAKGGGNPFVPLITKLLDGPFKAKLGADSDRFMKRTRHYLISTDVGMSDPALKALDKGRKAPAIDELALLLEQINVAYSGTFISGERDRDLVSRVFVFSDNADYLRWSKDLVGNVTGTAAFYAPDLRLLCVDAGAADKLGAWGRQCMFHEGFHQFLHYYLRPGLTPLWFNEGLAEYFGPSEMHSGAKIETGLLPVPEGAHGSRLDVAKHVERWIPLRELLLLDPRRFLDQRVGTNYAQSWAFVHYLCASPARKPLLVSYYKALRAGRSQQEAFTAVFEPTIDKLDQELRDYVRRLPSQAPTSSKKE